MILPEAIFDVLFIGSKVEKKMTDFSISEIHFFSYMACLLSIYDGCTSNAWRLNFIKSDVGGPFSKDINDAAEYLIGRGLIEIKEKSYYNLTAAGNITLDKYYTLSTLNNRKKFLDIACKSMLLVPYGFIKDAINNEPVLRSASNSSLKRILLDEETPATKVLHEQFKTLYQAIGEQKSLLIPAITWIESLNSNAIREND